MFLVFAIIQLIIFIAMLVFTDKDEDVEPDPEPYN